MDDARSSYSLPEGREAKGLSFDPIHFMQLDDRRVINAAETALRKCTVSGLM